MVTIAVILGIVGILPGIGWLVSPVVSVLACILGGKHIRAVNAGKVEGGKGGAIASVVLGVLGLLQAIVVWLIVLVMALVALISSTSAGYLSAQTSAMAMRGRNLFVGINQANTEREGSGMPAIWPTSFKTRGDDRKDISGQSFSTSTEYFNALFDMRNYGKTDWMPYVNCDLSVLSGTGNAYKGSGLLKDSNVDWLVLKGVTDDVPDVVPVLVSANVDPSSLITLGSFDGSSKTPIRLGRANGAAKDMFDNKACVVIYKSGAAYVFKVKYATLENLYNRQGFTLPAGIVLEYLAP